MIELGIVDLSASARRRLAALVERWTWASPDSRISTPRVSIHLLSPEEVRFHGGLDVCVVGPELLACDVAYLTALRKELADKLILCVLDARTQSLGVVEQLGRLGVDDVLLESAGADEFIRRLVLLQRRMRNRQRGKTIVVDSARGGVGVTFVAAAAAEAVLSAGESVCVVDCDTSSHDLTRFLRVKPHVSEPLRLLIEQQRLITAETVSECLHEVWSDEEKLQCVPPPAGCDDATLAAPSAARALVEVLDALASLHGRVVVDASALAAGVKRAVWGAADELIFVANGDPAGAFANKQALGIISGMLRADAALTVVLNDNSRTSAPASLMRREVLAAPGREARFVRIPHSARAARWACSGQTPYRSLRRHIQALVQPSGAAAQNGAAHRLFERGLQWIASLGRAAAQLVGFGRGEDLAVGTEGMRAGESGSREPLAIGFAQGLLAEGDLVSKPVLFG